MKAPTWFIILTLSYSVQAMKFTGVIYDPSGLEEEIMDFEIGYQGWRHKGVKIIKLEDSNVDDIPDSDPAGGSVLVPDDGFNGAGDHILSRNLTFGAKTKLEMWFAIYVSGYNASAVPKENVPDLNPSFTISMTDLTTGNQSEILDLARCNVTDETWNYRQFSVSVSEETKATIRFQLSRNVDSNAIALDEIKIQWVPVLGTEINLEHNSVLFQPEEEVTTAPPTPSTTVSTSTITATTKVEETTSNINQTTVQIPENTTTSVTNPSVEINQTTTENENSTEVTTIKNEETTSNNSNINQTTTVVVPENTTSVVTESSVSTAATENTTSVVTEPTAEINQTTTTTTTNEETTANMNQTTPTAVTADTTSSVDSNQTTSNTISEGTMSTIRPSSTTDGTLTNTTASVQVNQTTTPVTTTPKSEPSTTDKIDVTTTSPNSTAAELSEKFSGYGYTAEVVLICLVVVFGVMFLVMVVKYYRLSTSIGDYRLRDNNGARQTYDNPAFNGFGLQDTYRSR